MKVIWKAGIWRSEKKQKKRAEKLASLLVQEMGLEPTLPKQQVPETCASAYSATPAGY